MMKDNEGYAKPFFSLYLSAPDPSIASCRICGQQTESASGLTKLQSRNDTHCTDIRESSTFAHVWPWPAQHLALNPPPRPSTGVPALFGRRLCGKCSQRRRPSRTPLGPGRSHSRRSTAQFQGTPHSPHSPRSLRHVSLSHLCLSSHGYLVKLAMHFVTPGKSHLHAGKSSVKFSPFSPIPSFVSGSASQVQGPGARLAIELASSRLRQGLSGPAVRLGLHLGGRSCPRLAGREQNALVGAMPMLSIVSLENKKYMVR